MKIKVQTLTGEYVVTEVEQDSTVQQLKVRNTTEFTPYEAHSSDGQY